MEADNLFHSGETEALLLMPGTVLEDRFEIEGLVGQGGMCTVYKARHLGLNKPVAIKVLRINMAHNPTIVSRFKREAVAISNLDHPNVVKVFGFGICGWSPYMVMEFLDGQSLQDVLKTEKRLSRQRALPIFAQMCDGLEHAHQKGVVHRDLKPSNIVMTADDQIKLVDFGIAKILPESGKDIQALTQTSDVFGTLFYMSPEQCKGGAVDARADIYAAGCLMYEALTGCSPFTGATPFAVLHKQVNETPPENKLIDADLRGAIMKALEKDPANRQQSAAELKDGLLHGTPEPVKQSKKSGRKSHKMEIIAVSSALGIVVCAGLMIFQIMHPAHTGAPPLRSAAWFEQEIKALYVDVPDLYLQPARLKRAAELFAEVTPIPDSQYDEARLKLAEILAFEPTVKPIPDWPEAVKRIDRFESLVNGAERNRPNIRVDQEFQFLPEALKHRGQVYKLKIELCRARHDWEGALKWCVLQEKLMAAQNSQGKGTDDSVLRHTLQVRALALHELKRHAEAYQAEELRFDKSNQLRYTWNSWKDVIDYQQRQTCYWIKQKNLPQAQRSMKRAQSIWDQASKTAIPAKDLALLHANVSHSFYEVGQAYADADCPQLAKQAFVTALAINKDDAASKEGLALLGN